MNHSNQALTEKYEYAVLGSMLLLLHVSLWWDFGSAISRSLMLAHLGLFLLWQPIWRRDQRLDLASFALFCLFTAGFTYSLNWWVVSVWLVLLIGLAGARTITGRSERYVYLLSLVFLVSELLIKSVTELFSVSSISQPVISLFQYGLLIVPLAVSFMSAARRSEIQTIGADFLRGLAIALLSAMLAVGSLLNMYHTGVEYPVALFQTLVVIAAFLFLISWLLTPHRGFSGFAQLWEHSLLNIGTPFESWLIGLAEVAEHQQTPAQFLAAATTELVKLPWIIGVKWASPTGEGTAGEPSKHEVVVPAADLVVTLCTARPPGPTLTLHGKLLVELLSQFYVAKVREQELAQQAHLQAIFETGARVTHDIKNLLQSLHTITAAIDKERAEATDNHKAQRLFESQLPHITQRLQLALDKLQTPSKNSADQKNAQSWWDGLQGRYTAEPISFHGHIERVLEIPTELFDSVVENLLENARNKRAREADIEISVTLTVSDQELSLQVSDTGSPIADELVTNLMKGRVDSNDGLGIGLYQAAKQAELAGYSFDLRANQLGDVCFELRQAIAQPTELAQAETAR